MFFPRIFRMMIGLALLTMLPGHLMAAAPLLELTGPAYLAPGAANAFRYRGSQANTATLCIFRCDAQGQPIGQALYTKTGLTVEPKWRTIAYTGEEAAATGEYCAILTTAKPPHTARTRFAVKAWDIVGAFWDSLTEEDKAATDAVEADLPEGYDPSTDPFNDEFAEQEPPLFKYCAGMDVRSVTHRQIAVKVWRWDQTEAQARRLYITDGVYSIHISPEHWKTVWGMPVEKKPWYDERGAVLYTLNGIFYTTHGANQAYHVKFFVGKDGALDLAGNEFDENPDTPQREGGFSSTFHIDGQGQVIGSKLVAVPHRHPKVYAASPQPSAPPKISRYERAWTAYQQHVDQLAREREARMLEHFPGEREELAKLDAELAQREKEIVAQLRQRAQKQHRGKLDFEGEVPENRYLLGSSAASARIFCQLLTEGLVETDAVVGKLSWRPSQLDPEWIAWLRALIAETPADTPRWKTIASLLYRAGIERETYRPALERWAADGDAFTLHQLFFDEDKTTWRQLTVVSPANRELLTRLSTHASPLVRAVCADYAARVGDTALSERLCLEVLAMPYAQQICDGQHTAADRDLYFARHGASGLMGVQYTLFYLVRTERGFEALFNRAMVHHGHKPAQEVLGAAAGSSIYLEWDLRDAASLLYQVEAFQRNHPERTGEGQ